MTWASFVSSIMNLSCWKNMRCKKCMAWEKFIPWCNVPRRKFLKSRKMDTKPVQISIASSKIWKIKITARYIWKILLIICQFFLIFCLRGSFDFFFLLVKRGEGAVSEWTFYPIKIIKLSAILGNHKLKLYITSVSEYSSTLWSSLYRDGPNFND